MRMTFRSPNLGVAYNDAYRAAPTIPGQVNGKYGNTSSYQNVGNPILDINSQNSKTVDNRLEGTAFIEYKPVPWLTLKSSLGEDWENSVNTVYNYAFAADTVTFITGGGNQSNLYSNLGINSAEFLPTGFRSNTITYNRQLRKTKPDRARGNDGWKKRKSFYTYASAKGVPPEPNLAVISATPISHCRFP